MAPGRDLRRNHRSARDTRAPGHRAAPPFRHRGLGGRAVRFCLVGTASGGVPMHLKYDRYGFVPYAATLLIFSALVFGPRRRLEGVASPVPRRLRTGWAVAFVAVLASSLRSSADPFRDHGE